MNPLRFSLIFGCIVLLFIAGACQPSRDMGFARNWHWKDATITLTPTGQPGTETAPGSVTLPGNNGCTKGSGLKLGCLKFARLDTGIITFALAGQPDIKTCSDAGINRVITKIELTDRDATSGPSDKGDFYASPSNPLPAMVRDDAFTQLDIDTGVAYGVANYVNGLSRVTLINLNQPGNTTSTGMDLWYKVTISRCSDGEVWVTDPRLENEGMN